MVPSLAKSARGLLGKLPQRGQVDVPTFFLGYRLEAFRSARQTIGAGLPRALIAPSYLTGLVATSIVTGPQGYRVGV